MNKITLALITESTKNLYINGKYRSYKDICDAHSKKYRTRVTLANITDCEIIFPNRFF